MNNKLHLLILKIKIKLKIKELILNKLYRIKKMNFKNKRKKSSN